MEAAIWPRLWQPDEDDGQVSSVAAQADTREALGLLAPADRDAVVLRYVEGWTSAEIAQLQGGSAGTIRWRLHRALERLRAELTDQHDKEGPNR